MEKNNKSNYNYFSLSILQLEIIRSCFSEICYALNFDDFREEIGVGRDYAVFLHKKIIKEIEHIEHDSINYECGSQSKSFDSLQEDSAHITFNKSDAHIIVKVLQIVMRELEEWEFPIRTGHEYKAAQDLEKLLLNFNN